MIADAETTPNNGTRPGGFHKNLISRVRRQFVNFSNYKHGRQENTSALRRVYYTFTL